MPVVVVDYDPTWPDRFDAIRRLLEDALGDSAIAIEHAGSTAVPGLAARPIIDVDVAVADYSRAHELRPALEAAGFRRSLAGDLPDRQWYVREEAGQDTCHLSLTYLKSETWLSHRALRDRLLNDVEALREYGGLKKLAAEHGDAIAYAAAKTEAIERLAGSAWRTPPERRPLISRSRLLGGGFALLALLAATGGVIHYTETSRGSDGLPDHRAVRAADLASRPEANLYYPGSTVVRRAASDQGSDPGSPAAAPAKIDTLLATAAPADALRAWYGERLAGAGWQAMPSSSAGLPAAQEVDLEWRRGSREFFDLRLYLDGAALGSEGNGLAGLLYRVVYLIGTGRG